MIVCIQDLNKNGKMDYSESLGRKRPAESFGHSGPAFPGLWDDLKFEVDKGISEIEIRISNP